MAEFFHSVDEIPDLIAQGRVPQLVEGWTGGPYCVVPPEQLNPADGCEFIEQTGLFTCGYGDFIFFSPEDLARVRTMLGMQSSRD